MGEAGIRTGIDFQLISPPIFSLSMLAAYRKSRPIHFPFRAATEKKEKKLF